MTILVIGATGALGTLVADEVRRRGMAVRTAARSGADVAVDLVSGSGLDAAVVGIDAVIHCATDPLHHRRVDVDGTLRLLEKAPVPMVFPSIVGCDVIPLGYYRSKLAGEEMVAAHRPGFTILRATQFHDLVWSTLERLSRPPVMVVPHDTRVQVIDPATVARLLVDAAVDGPAGRLDDIGGPFAYEARDLARSVLAATGRKRPILRVNLPGLTGAAFRAGGNLTPNRDEDGDTWNEFVEKKVSGDR